MVWVVVLLFKVVVDELVELTGVEGQCGTGRESFIDCEREFHLYSITSILLINFSINEYRLKNYSKDVSRFSGILYQHDLH